MSRIEFPKLLNDLLEGSDLQAPIRALADRVGEILSDNKLTFFPDYTDHGVEHIIQVLKSEVDLIPDEVWSQSTRDSKPRLLFDADAAVIVGATLLHDIAMHLQPTGFLDLVREDSRFQPLSWFKSSREGHSGDRPWSELWIDYQREARRFSDRALANIIGLDSVRQGWKFRSLPNDMGQWERNECLMIGEFIRRHHARLAHEIAIYGFPGIPVGSNDGHFPALGSEKGHPLRSLADLIGLTARSHGTSLRVCTAYIDSVYARAPRPANCAVLYPMALLRVADYLQIDRPRAPAVLLQLRNPQSPISIQEWNKHQAVENIGPGSHPRGRAVTASRDIGLSLYLQLRDLLDGLQAEIDHASAVLDEVYGTRSDIGLDQLGLKLRRIESNLFTSDFREGLPYVPNRIGFSSDPNLLTLLVEPLYGKFPGVGVRELIQNAVDSVCELSVWMDGRKDASEQMDLASQDVDVLVEYICRDDSTWILRIRDKGIGMTVDTVQNYFLRAGASFRQSTDWLKEFVNEDGSIRVLRAGRFGIGVFAIFLLGARFRLWTRHASAPKSMGYTLEASVDAQSIEIGRDDTLTIGTTIEVDLSAETVKQLRLDNWTASTTHPTTDWYCWDWPTVRHQIIRGTSERRLTSKHSAPLRKSKPTPDWSLITAPGFDAVYWTFANAPKLACNGLKIAAPDRGETASQFDWPGMGQFGLRAPSIAVLDSASNLPLTIQRYGLSQKTLPFIDELERDVVLSFIAHALVCGPVTQLDALLPRSTHPLSMLPFSENKDKRQPIGKLRWCASAKETTPIDPTLFSLLKISSYGICGVIARDAGVKHPTCRSLAEIGSNTFADLPLLMRLSQLSVQRLSDTREIERFKAQSSGEVIALLKNGVKSLSLESSSARLVVCSPLEGNLMSHLQMKLKSGRAQGILIESLQPLEHHEIFEIRKGTMSREVSRISIEQMLTSTATVSKGLNPIVVYSLEIEGGLLKDSPSSLIAKVWNECIGPHPIPFELQARNSLIAQCKQHSELGRHINAWEELKAAKSKWTTVSAR